MVAEARRTVGQSAFSMGEIAQFRQLSLKSLRKVLKNNAMALWRWYCSLLKPPTDAKRQRWQKVKARGKKNFILRVGVLGWGGFMFVLMTVMFLIRKPPFPRQAIDYIFEIAINLLVWPIAGYFWGTSMWRFYETYFGEPNQQSHADPTLSK